MAKWPQTTLGQISQIYSGFAFRSQDLGDHGIPVLKIANIQNKRVSPECSDHFPEELYTCKLNRFLLHPDDTLIAMTGAGSVGKVGKMPRNPGRFLVNQRVAIVRPNSSKCDPAFVYFALSQDHYEKLLYGLGLGAGQPNVSGKQIGELELPYPDLPIQRRIAGILSAYDELIENSQRRIKILEAMARALYREWFVHFRFPGHESVPRIPPSLGDVPPEWEVRKLADLCTLAKDAYKDVNHSELPLLDLARMPSRTLAPQETGKPPELTTSRIVFQPGDTLFGAIRCYLHKVVVMHYAGVTNTSVLVLRPKKAHFRSLLAVIASDVETIRWAETQSTGTKMPVINWGVFQNMPTPIPSHSLAQEYERLAGPMLDEIGTLATQIQTLRRTRDLLLPRLLSGQIDVGVEEETLADIRQVAQSAAVPQSVEATALARPARASAPAQTSSASQDCKETAASPKLDDITREDALIAIRRAFSEGGSRERDDALRDVAYALGFKRLGARIETLISNELSTAVRRGILVKDEGGYRLGFRSYAECTRDSLKNDFESAMGRGWMSRDDAIRAFARWSGFARVGEVIEETARSLINGLIREGRIEADGPELIRRTKAD